MVDKTLFFTAIGEEIKRLREKKRYTREEFSEIADISPKFLYEIEVQGKGFSSYTLFRITRALHISFEDLVLCLNKDADLTNKALSNEQAEIVIETIVSALHFLY